MALCPVKRDGMEGKLVKIRENSFDFDSDFLLYFRERERDVWVFFYIMISCFGDLNRIRYCAGWIFLLLVYFYGKDLCKFRGKLL